MVKCSVLCVCVFYCSKKDFPLLEFYNVLILIKYLHKNSEQPEKEYLLQDVFLGEGSSTELKILSCMESR